MSEETQTKPEQKPGKGRSSAGIVVLLVLLSWMGGVYLDRTSGGFNPEVYAPYPSYAYVKEVQGGGDLPPNFNRGKELYSIACVSCHQANGLGAAGVAPPLAGSDWVLAPQPHRLVRVVYNGLKGPITVKGEVFNASVMLNMGRQMGYSVEDMAAVLTFIRTNSDWGNEGAPVTAAQIQEDYDAAKARTSQWTEAELSTISVD